MRIPDGDLVPARRRAYAGGYARRARYRSRRTAVVVVVLLAAVAVAWFVRRDRPAAEQATACPTPTATSTATSAPSAAALPAPSTVRVVVLNGTSRVALAETVGRQLTARGFVVVRTDNASAAAPGPSVVTYAVGARGAATVLARHVAGAQLSAAGTAPAGTVQLVLGPAFRRLATSAEVTAAAAAASRAAVVPAPTRTPCSS
ncbi:MAG TPA: LytR C-terminal domain-containing protein [Mycobacteriales bacterium]|nr:LytR C-terminal domain-containing protein [Mycobacteriales bacterium]